MEPDLNTDGFHRPVLLNIFVFNLVFYYSFVWLRAQDEAGSRPLFERT